MMIIEIFDKTWAAFNLVETKITHLLPVVKDGKSFGTFTKHSIAFWHKIRYKLYIT